MWEWEVIAGIVAIIGLAIALYDRHKKSLISDKKIESEIKKYAKGTI